VKDALQRRRDAIAAAKIANEKLGQIEKAVKEDVDRQKEALKNLKPEEKESEQDFKLRKGAAQQAIKETEGQVANAETGVEEAEKAKTDAENAVKGMNLDSSRSI
jgi:hypothetical protein